MSFKLSQNNNICLKIFSCEISVFETGQRFFLPYPYLKTTFFLIASRVVTIFENSKNSGIRNRNPGTRNRTQVFPSEIQTLCLINGLQVSVFKVQVPGFLFNTRIMKPGYTRIKGVKSY